MISFFISVAPNYQSGNYIFRALHDQTDQALGEVQAQLARADNDLATEIERNKALERQNMQLENQTKDLKQEINNLRCRMSQLDREKDQIVVRTFNFFYLAITILNVLYNSCLESTSFRPVFWTESETFSFDS